MEFLTREQKKAKARRLHLGYLLLSVLVGLATYVLVSTALGYEVFTRGNTIVQNGLLFVSSRPDNAKILIDGVPESNATNTKLSLPEDLYEISLIKVGYRDWKRSVPLSGGEVRFITYPKLMPTNPLETSVYTFSDSKAVSLQSRDKDWLVTMPVPTRAEWLLFDLTRPDLPPTTMTVPASVLSESEGATYELINWAGDNQHILARQVLPEGRFNYFIIDRTKPDQSQGVSIPLGLSYEKPDFWDGKWDQYYYLDASGLPHLANLKEKTVDSSSVFADKVIQIKALSDARFAYTTALADGQIALKVYADKKTYVVSTFAPSDKPITIVNSGFNRNDYLAVSGGSLPHALLFKNVVSAAKKSTIGRATPFLTFPIPGQVVEFSRGNRFLMARDGATIVIYDIEQKDIYRYQLPGLEAVGSQVAWLDDARLSVVYDGSMYVVDFDSSNLYQLIKTGAGEPYTNADASLLFSTVTNNNTPTLKSYNLQDSGL